MGWPMYRGSSPKWLPRECKSGHTNACRCADRRRCIPVSSPRSLHSSCLEVVVVVFTPGCLQWKKQNSVAAEDEAEESLVAVDVAFLMSWLDEAQNTPFAEQIDV